MLLCYRTACRLRRFLCRIKTEKRFLFLIFLEKGRALLLSKRQHAGMYAPGMRVCLALQRIPGKNAVVIGISKDSAASHGKFAEKFGLPLRSALRSRLTGDPGVRRLAGEKAVRAKWAWASSVTTFLIDEAGKIIKVCPRSSRIPTPQKSWQCCNKTAFARIPGNTQAAQPRKENRGKGKKQEAENNLVFCKKVPLRFRGFAPEMFALQNF